MMHEQINQMFTIFKTVMSKEVKFEIKLIIKKFNAQIAANSIAINIRV